MSIHSPPRKDDTVHIACGFDSRMELPFLVLASSIKRRLPGGRKVVLHALHSDPLVHERAFSPGSDDGTFEVRYKQIENPYMGMLPGHPKVATMIRFMLPSLLADVDRLIYLDTDMIVLNDITLLYDMDLGGHTMAAALDYALIAVFPQRRWHITAQGTEWDTVQFLTEVVQLTDWKAYFNSGVIVMDLARFRSEDFVTRAVEFLERTEKKHHLVDQDSLNHVIDGAFTRLDFRWNVNTATRDATLFDGAHPDFGDIASSWRSTPWILHYCGTGKPWDPAGWGTIWDRHFWQEAAGSEAFPLLLGNYLKQCGKHGHTRLQPAASCLALGKPAFHKSQLDAHAGRFGHIPGVLQAGAQFISELDLATKTVLPGSVQVPADSFKHKAGILEGDALVFQLSRAAGHIVYGPYHRYPPGDYEALFEISLSPDADGPQCTLIMEVASHVDCFLAQRSLSTARDLCETSPTLKFTVAETDPFLEFRIFADGFSSGLLRFAGVSLRAV